jgi:hypothetical protein
MYGRWYVVIRADGGTGLPAWMVGMFSHPIIYGINNLAEESSSAEEPGQIVYPINNPVQPSPAKLDRLLLIDLDDRHHPVLRRWSRQRWIAYAQQGWYSPGVDPAQARIERFLANRPKGEI